MRRTTIATVAVVAVAAHATTAAAQERTKEECISVAVNSRQPWDRLRSTMPAVGGRMGVERIAELTSCLGREVVFVLGSRIQQHQQGVVAAIDEFQMMLTRSV